jgi:hypothetical protein
LIGELRDHVPVVAAGVICEVALKIVQRLVATVELEQ